MTQQEALIGALSSLDELIALHEAKLVLLKKHRQGLVQQFTQKPS